ncbi:hypothetical protein AB0I89_24020 [Micromonospora sp. NPDC049801]|uniref:hypothetical protein n=1 Tax=unclassified Micromonospora TaxID=2617518 RepID=UPI0033E3392B
MSMRHTNAQIAGMFKPASCNRCRNGMYDIGTVEVTARYTDCSVWRTPCCKQVVDDRGETGWTTRRDYEVIDKSRIDPDDRMPWRGQVDVFGMWRG